MRLVRKITINCEVFDKVNRLWLEVEFVLHPIWDSLGKFTWTSVLIFIFGQYPVLNFWNVIVLCTGLLSSDGH